MKIAFVAYADWWDRLKFVILKFFIRNFFLKFFLFVTHSAPNKWRHEFGGLVHIMHFDGHTRKKGLVSKKGKRKQELNHGPEVVKTGVFIYKQIEDILGETKPVRSQGCRIPSLQF